MCAGACGREKDAGSGASRKMTFKKSHFIEMEKRYCLCCHYLLSPLSLPSSPHVLWHLPLAWVSLLVLAAWGDRGQLTTLPYQGG